jgi:hypothetical protein
MVDEQQPDKDDQEQKEALLRRRAEANSAMKAFRLTREQDQQFSIDMGDGTDVQDSRPLRPRREIDSTPAPTQSRVKPPPVPPATEPETEGITPPSSKARSLSPQTQAKLQELATAFGIVINQVGNHLEYVRISAGRELSLFSEAGTAAGVATAEIRLKKASIDSMNMIGAKFTVRFSSIDEVFQNPPTRAGRRATASFARQPSFFELDAIADALYPSDPAHKTLSGEPVRFCFVDQRSDQHAPVLLNTKDDGSLDVYVYADAVSVSQNQARTRQHAGTHHAQTTQQQVHILARFFIDAFAQYSVYKAGSMQPQLIPDQVRHLGRFRGGPSERKHLQREDRNIYQRTKDFDQWEINKYYGLQPDGTEVKLRLPNGKLVHGKQEMRDEIHRFEETTN